MSFVHQSFQQKNGVKAPLSRKLSKHNENGGDPRHIDG
ncbi:hypothetical protein L581_1509 [Serratia fonticola AU-AP2C]|nr:hypothetical protein L581_1509 [Serratia fonticola AU-AP2C]